MARKRTQQRGMEEAPENGKESSHSAHANGMECVTKDIHNRVLKKCTNLWRDTQGQCRLAVVIKSSGLNISVSNTVPTFTINGISLISLNQTAVLH